jgi:thiamine pyrophosphate-dependent acetolactate synthase large subunit-like protein
VDLTPAGYDALTSLAYPHRDELRELAPTLKPEVVAHELNKYLRDDAIVTCDSGTIATWAARHIRIRRGQRFSLSGNLATIANGFPYAIGAQVAYPDRQVVAFVGDGGFSMLMAEVLRRSSIRTSPHYHQRLLATRHCGEASQTARKSR